MSHTEVILFNDCLIQLGILRNRIKSLKADILDPEMPLDIKQQCLELHHKEVICFGKFNTILSEILDKIHLDIQEGVRV